DAGVALAQIGASPREAFDRPPPRALPQLIDLREVAAPHPAQARQAGALDARPCQVGIAETELEVLTSDGVLAPTGPATHAETATVRNGAGSLRRAPEARSAATRRSNWLCDETASRWRQGAPPRLCVRRNHCASASVTR